MADNAGIYNPLHKYNLPTLYSLVHQDSQSGIFRFAQFCSILTTTNIRIRQTKMDGSQTICWQPKAEIMDKSLKFMWTQKPCIYTSVTTARKINNDHSKVIIMTQIMTQSNENTDLILTLFTQNIDLATINDYFLVVKHYINAIYGFKCSCWLIIHIYIKAKGIWSV